jgi:hypothetical protein
MSMVAMVAMVMNESIDVLVDKIVIHNCSCNYLLLVIYNGAQLYAKCYHFKLFLFSFDVH